MECNTSLNLEAATSATSKDEHGPTGFFTLPQELRDKVYGFCFEDMYDDVEVDLYKAIVRPQGHPYACVGITLACKQLRHETFKLYRAAMERFWLGHVFFIEIDVTRATDEQIKDQAIMVAAMVRRRAIPTLKGFSFKISWKEDDRPSTITATSSSVNGIDWQYVVSTPKNASDDMNECLYEDLMDLTEDRWRLLRGCGRGSALNMGTAVGIIQEMCQSARMDPWLEWFCSRKRSIEAGNRTTRENLHETHWP